MTRAPTLDDPSTGTSTAPAGAGSDSSVGRTELGTIRVSDEAVAKIAALAAAEVPDAGASATRVLGRAVPGGGHLGIRSADLDGFPKATADVDGSVAYVSIELSVRWPASVPHVTSRVRERVRDQVQQLTGLTIPEVRIAVTDLVTDVPSPSRVN